jgi:tetratricopeptide (TPR) repeat protein
MVCGMADEIEQRDFFVSFNSADLAYAEAIDAALKVEGFTTFFHPSDLHPHGHIPSWMDKSLMNSAQTLALYSPDYTKEEAVYSRAELYATWWQDPTGDRHKLIPVVLRETTFSPLIALIKRIEVMGRTPTDAAAEVVRQLKSPTETKQRNHWRIGLPLPKVFNVLYRPNPNFTGRFQAMESLQKSLREGNAAITAVAGMGGIGKTTLAAEYCHRFGGRYGGVWWVRAEQKQVMLANLAALGQRLGLAATSNIEADARAALESVSSRTEPWLMVYDNAPNADAVSKWLPAGAVRCLITSRFAGFDGVATVTRLDQWSDEVIVDYLLARTGREDKAGALRLCRSLDGLPLAAEQAAVFLKNRQGITFDDYAREIARLIKEEKPAGAKGDYPKTVYAAFVKSLKTLDGMIGGRTALDLLRLSSFLSPDGVDLVLLTVEWGKIVLPTDFAAAIVDTFLREDALADLASLSLLRQEKGLAGGFLIFHRLLLEVVRDRMGAADRDLWGTAAVRLVNALFPDMPGTNTLDWLVCDRLLSHVAPLETYAPRTQAAGQNLGRLLYKASTYLDIRGDGAGALAFAEKSVALIRSTCADEPLVLATALNHLGAMYNFLSRLGECEAALREALAIQEPRLDPNDPRLASTLLNLSAVLGSRRQFVKAESLALRAAKLISAHDPASAQYGSLLCSLGKLYFRWADEPGQAARRRRRQAEMYATQGLEVIRAALGTRHPATASEYGDLALMKAKKRDWRGAAADMERKIAIITSLDLLQHGDKPHDELHNAAKILYESWQRSGQRNKAARILRGDISDLLRVIATIEAEHTAWVAEDPKNRHFGPRSPF